MTTKENPIALAEMKSQIRANLGSPQNNANAAKTLEGTVFYAENLKGEFVLATLLGSLSLKGKLQAELACSVEDCEEMHVREQSDWHQSLKCATHAATSKARLTDEEKQARALARAQATVARLSKAAEEE